MRKIIFTFLLILILLLEAWAPWMTLPRAETLAKQAFETSWQGVADGCGFNCAGCGVTASSKALFGARVQIEYACGLLPSDSPEYHRKSTGFVSLFGTVHGLPHP